MRSVAVVSISTLALAVVVIVAPGCSLRGRDDREAATDLRQAIAVAWEHHVARSGGEVAFPLRVGQRCCVVRHRLWRARTASPRCVTYPASCTTSVRAHGDELRVAFTQAFRARTRYAWTWEYGVADDDVVTAWEHGNWLPRHGDYFLPPSRRADG